MIKDEASATLLSGCIIRENVAGRNGGAIYAGGKNLSIGKAI